MGMYTEIRTDFVVSDASARQILDQMMDGTAADIPQEFLPDHPIFRTTRWCYLFTMTSAYFDTYYRERHEDIPLGQVRYKTCANLKNYEDDIRLFANWIRPYCIPQKTPIVTQRYESSQDTVTCYYADGHTEVVPFKES